MVEAQLNKAFFMLRNDILHSNIFGWKKIVWFPPW